MKEIVLIEIAGADRPGLLSAFCEILNKHAITILDIGQAAIHSNLTLGMLVLIPTAAQSAPVIKDLLFKAHTLDLKLNFSPVSESDYDNWVKEQGKKRHIITLIGREITAEHLARISAVITKADMNIAVITRLSGRVDLKASQKDQTSCRACIEFAVRGTPNDENWLRQEFLRISTELGVDIAYQEDNIFRRNRRLVVFDMDSTLIQTEVMDELAREAGVGEQVRQITASAMRGEIDFKESFRQRLALIRGLSAEKVAEVAERLPMTEGAQRLITNLKRFGYKIAIVSGGFTYFGRKLQTELGIDYLYANELAIEDGMVTGQVQGTIVDGQEKARLVRLIAEKEQISLQQVIAVGDGANDLPMLSIAGLGIAFHAKPVVKKGARQSISTLGLDGILYLIGVRDRDTL